MPNYEEIIQQSQENVKALSEKLKELDKLHEDIKTLIKLPGTFDDKFQEIVELTENYTNTLGASTKKYLDGNNTLFTTKLSELSEKSKDLQIKIDTLKKQVERLENIDLEKHFDKLQKTLSDIFGAINSINLTLTAITQTLNSIVQSLGEIKNAIDTNHKETKQIISSFSATTEKHLKDQDKQSTKNNELLENKMNSLAEQNELLRKAVKTNRIIQLIGVVVMIIILIYVVIK